MRGLSQRLRGEFQPGFPPKAHLRRWPAEHQRQDSTLDYDNVDDTEGVPNFLTLPDGTPEFSQLAASFGHDKSQNTFGPIETFKYLKFGRYLKSLANGDEALVAAVSVACNTKELEDNVNATKKRRIRMTAFYKARLKLDPVTMCIERREIFQIYEEAPDSLLCLQLFSDGSPPLGSSCKV